MSPPTHTPSSSARSAARRVNVVIAGVVTSVCIDSTARVAADKGYNVSILSDCTAGRSAFEQEFYCSEIFPIFSTVSSVDEILAAFSNRVAA